MQNKVLIITGMHRSGTSLISNWLHKCGLELGETLMAPSIANQEGYFEDMEFLKLNVEILADNNLPVTGLTDEYRIPVSLYNKEKIKTVIQIKNSLFEQWGWKEPRTSLFLDTYKELIPGAKYLVIVRDYHYVVSSLLKREFRDIDKKYRSRSVLFDSLALIKFRRKKRLKRYYRTETSFFLKVHLNYNEAILRFLETLPANDYLVVNYNLLKSNDCNIYKHLTSDWGFDLKYVNFNEVFNEKLMNDPLDTDAYITDKSLIEKALEQEERFKKYMTASEKQAL